MDWFVLLTPLIVLPIVLLFAFVGCTLPRSGTGPDKTESIIYFSYSTTRPDISLAGALSDLDVQLKSVDIPITIFKELKRSGDEILQSESVAIGSVPFATEGDVLCVITYQKGTVKTIQKHKIAFEDIGFSMLYDKKDSGPAGFSFN